MATTNLVIDFLLAGFSALFWLLPVYRLFSGSYALPPIDAAYLPPAFGALYILGIAVNRVVDDLLAAKATDIEKKVFGAEPDPSYHVMLNTVIVKCESAAEYLNYRRSIVRISRCTAINALLGAAVVATGMLRPHYAITPTDWAVIISLGALGLIMYRGWRKGVVGYYRAILNFFELTRSTEAAG